MVARRPRGRKAQIARASAEAFSALGYHGVTMETIASRVGISTRALHRHYPSKYVLFRDAVLSLSQQLVDATAFADDGCSEKAPFPDDAAAAAVLRDVIAALIDTAMANRTAGGLYRWEARYLRDEDQDTLSGHIRVVHQRIQRPLRRLRPELTSQQRWTLSTSVLSVVGSVVDHRAKLPAARIKAVLADLAAVIVDADLAGSSNTLSARGSARRPPASTYDALLDESMRQFNAKGYRDTTVEDIASAVGLPAPGVYRYFSRKSDLLCAVFRRAGEWLAGEVDAIAARAPTPRDALWGIIDSYVDSSFAFPEFETVYYAERRNLPAADQNLLRGMQRATVESWTQLVVAVRPELTTGEARFVVHAAMALVIDVGRLSGYRTSERTKAMLGELLDLTLAGRYRLRMALPAR
ncbi:MAG: TetR/AcrR family transcriptional regulator [Mycobacterium sp.]